MAQTMSGFNDKQLEAHQVWLWEEQCIRYHFDYEHEPQDDWSYTKRKRRMLAQTTVCDNCGAGGKLEVDHVIPRSRQGCNCWKNLQVLCVNCNRAKHNLLMSEWVLTGLWPDESRLYCHDVPGKIQVF